MILRAISIQAAGRMVVWTTLNWVNKINEPG